MEVSKPLIIKGIETETRVLEVTVEADLSEGEAKVRYHTIDSASKQSTLHATCVVTFEDTTAWTNSWNNMAYLIEGRRDILKERLARNQADKMSRSLLYRLFSTFVDYKLPYQGMEEVIIDGANFEATSRVVFQTQDKDGNFFCCPYWIDSLMHLAGFILNGGSAVDTKQFVYISHGWKALKFAVPLDRTKTYHSYVKMQNTGESNVMAGDVYVFDNNTIVAMCAGLKFQRIPRTLLNSFLPPQPSASGAAVRPQLERKPNNQVNVTTKASAAVAKFQKAKPIVVKPTLSTTARVIELISAESELPLSELQDESTFASLGIDSLLSLQILGKLREALDLDLPANVFIDCETVGDLKNYLNEVAGDSDPSSASTSIASTSTAATSPSILTDKGDDYFEEPKAAPSVPLQSSLQIVKKSSSDDNLLMLFRETISEQMGIAMEEVVGSNDLLSLGMDSLMSICILGVIREKTELDLPPDFFLNHSSVDDIAKFLNINPTEKSEPIKQKPKVSRSIKTRTPRGAPQSAAPLPRAVSILLQGKPRTATKTLFLLPDGSGSATSYTTIPAVDPSVAVYGLNSPYMRTPTQFINGIPGVASQYLEEIRRRQPVGPYHLGGWSAGGVVAYEITLQLMAVGERVESLVLFDSPCPIALEPLPSRLHHFFAEVGLIGMDEGTKLPDWLLPHFEASIKALTAYKPQPIPAKYSAQAPRTLAIWARHGVCRYEDSPRPEVRGDESKSMKWLLNNRTDFGPNGWEKLLGNAAIETMSLNGNHFSLMKDEEEVSTPFALYSVADC